MDLDDENSRESVVIDQEDLQYLLPVEFTTTDTSAIINGNLNYNNGIHELQQRRVVIVEQPQQRGFRFRYECEGPSHGGLQGEKTERGRKTYPSIRVENYEGPARIEVSLVTDETHPKIHAHKLVGKNCKDGICKYEISSTASQISFPNLCILHVTRKKAADVLFNRLLEELKMSKRIASGQMNEPNITAEEHLNIKQQASELARSMQLNVVRLQFRVLLPNQHGDYLVMLTPVVSQPIYDSKSPGASALKICRMDKYGGCCTGNEEVFLLCEKVQKEDISVRFVENNPDGSVKWEAYGNFSPLDVHRQYAIVFKTPAYYNSNIDKAVNVMIMLQRKSDCEVSEAKAFTYYPQNKDKDNIARKKRKTLPLDSTFNYYGGDGGGPPGGATGGGGGFGSHNSTGHNGGLGGGVGGGNSSNSFSVILPNGSIIDQLNVLPTTVEQVVKEEFARSSLSNSPETTSTEDSYQSPLASPFDPMLWGPSANIMNDLEMDAAHSLPHPAQRLFASHVRSDGKHQRLGAIAEGPAKEIHQRKSASLKTDKNTSTSSGRGSSSIEREGEGRRFPIQEEVQHDTNISKWPEPEQDQAGLNTVAGLAEKLQSASVGLGPGTAALPYSATVKAPVSSDNSAQENIRACPAQPVPQARKADKATSDSHGSVLDILSYSTGECDRTAPSNKGSDDSVTITATSSQLRRSRPPSHSETDSGRDLSDSAMSPTRLSTMSEGVRTDEGFSEVSTEDTLLQPAQENQDSTPAHKAKHRKEDTKEMSKTVKVATSVVKRVMEKITARTVRALQDYSETGDIRYLLVIQRHLTAIKNENGDLPIHLTVINNQTVSLRNFLDIMTSLPSARHVINTYNYTRQTALHLAAIMKQSLHIEMLLHAGADPSLADRNGNTPAHLAIMNNSLEALQSLVKYLRPGVSAANPFPELDYLNYDGYAPVHLAVQMSNVDILRLLVHGKANIDMPDGKSGRTALHHAVELDDLPVAGFLLMEAEADVNARCFDGNTPLHIACCRGLIGMVALLMTAGALTDIENEEIPSEEELEEGEMKEMGETSHRNRRGLQPRDYAAGKDRVRIVSMLSGEQYESEEESTPSPASDRDLQEDTELLTTKSVCDSGVSTTSLAFHSTTLSVPVEGEEVKLSGDLQKELCKLLDPVHSGKDVYALAECLGYSEIIEGLEVLGLTGASPTEFLLNYHETYHGTVKKLKECLQAITRYDAVHLIEENNKALLRHKQQCDSSIGDSGIQMSFRT